MAASSPRTWQLGSRARPPLDGRAPHPRRLRAPASSFSRCSSTTLRGLGLLTGEHRPQRMDAPRLHLAMPAHAMAGKILFRSDAREQAPVSPHRSTLVLGRAERCPARLRRRWGQLSPRPRRAHPERRSHVPWESPASSRTRSRVSSGIGNSERVIFLIRHVGPTASRAHRAVPDIPRPHRHRKSGGSRGGCIECIARTVASDPPAQVTRRSAPATARR